MSRVVTVKAVAVRGGVVSPIASEDYAISPAAAANAEMVALSTDYSFLTSAYYPGGGAPWVSMPGPQAAVRKVAYGGPPSHRLWAAVGQSASTHGAYAAYSDDGATWVETPIGEICHDVYWSVGLGLFVAVGYDGLFTSPDGVTWTQRLDYGLTLVREIDGNRTIAISNYDSRIYHSSDGVNWPYIESDGWWGAIAGFQLYWNGSTWVYVIVDGNDNVFRSTDLETWSVEWHSEIHAGPYSLMASNGNRIVLFRVNVDGTVPALFTSDNGGLSFVQRTPPAVKLAGGIGQFIYAGGTFMAAGESLDGHPLVLFSPGGITPWTPQALPEAVHGRQVALGSMADFIE
jgi:hypothetical protein